MPSIIQEIKTQIHLASTTNSILFSEAKKEIVIIKMVEMGISFLQSNLKTN